MEKEGAIVDASDGEENNGRPQRQRNPPAKFRENEVIHVSTRAASVPAKKQPGSVARSATAHGGKAKDGEAGDENATQPTMQEQMKEQTGILRILVEELNRVKNELQTVKEECQAVRAECQAVRAECQAVKEECQAVKEECQGVKKECQALKDKLNTTGQQMADGIAALATGQDSPRPSYAEVARTPPTSQPSNVQTLSTGGTTPSTFTSTLYCTIDTSRVEGEASDQVSAGAIRTMVETGVRTEQDKPSWRCRAVTKSPKNPHRIRIACRDEEEHKTVKRVVEAKLVPGARILRDDLFPIRVDGVNRTAVLDETGNIRAGATEAFGKENDTQVAKIAWLSNRDIPKAYGSMVVYLTRGPDARRFLQEGFFYAGGESGFTKAFERRERPNQCFNCQEITSHKAHQCTKAQVCGRCAKEGHRHSECTETILKCVPCGGPHESFSRNCRKLYPLQHE